MNISNDILRHSLKNVYFLIGTACGGKTTMAKELAEKYGFIHFNDNWHEENFSNWESIQAERKKNDESSIPDWEHYFNRHPEEFTQSLNAMILEYAEYALIEMIKLSQNNTVIADIHLPTNLVKELASHNQVACLLAPPELVIRDYYKRDDHREIYECIMSLKNPEKSLENMNNTFRLGTQRTIDEVKASGLFYLMRDDFSTVEKTLTQLEKHFGLT